MFEPLNALVINCLRCLCSTLEFPISVWRA